MFDAIVKFAVQKKLFVALTSLFLLMGGSYAVPTLEARQLINEQMQTVAGEIPTELGTPERMPITTGLGDDYQYVCYG